MENNGIEIILEIIKVSLSWCRFSQLKKLNMILQNSEDGPVRKNGAIVLARLNKDTECHEIIRSKRGIEIMRDIAIGSNVLKSQ